MISVSKIHFSGRLPPMKTVFLMDLWLDIIALACKIQCFAIFERWAGQKCVELPAVLRSGDERSHDFNP